MANSLDYTETIAVHNIYKLDSEESESSEFELEFIFTPFAASVVKFS